MRMLTQAPHQRLSIIAIAFECGFTSEAHFSRVFRAEYGVPPSRARADAINARASGPNEATGIRPYRTDLADWIRTLQPSASESSPKRVENFQVNGRIR